MINLGARRSQVDAPIELVIAIIILLASLSIAMLIFGDTGKQKCFAELRGEVQKLQLAMQDLALQSPPSTRSVYFTFPSCGSERIDILRFAYYSRPEYCKACAGQYAGCWKLEMASWDRNAESYTQSPELYNSGICVDVSGNMILYDQNDQGGMQDPECQPLSDTPCSSGIDLLSDSECTFQKSGVIRDVFNPGAVAETSSRWKTLGREASTYQIRLTKAIGTCPDSSSCPAIAICAKPLRQNQ